MNRIYSLDFLKFICTFLVIYIHAGKDVGIFNTICIVAVPIYFIISGFLYERVVIKNGHRKEQMRQIFNFFISAFLFYCLWDGITFVLVKKWSFRVMLEEQFSVIALLKLIILNAPSFGYHLWYLLALLYVLLFFYVIEKFSIKKYIVYISLFLLVVGIGIPWIMLIFELPFRVELVRNYLFEGIPLFYIGRLLSKRKYEKTVNWKGYLFRGIALFALLICESYFYQLYDVSTTLTVVTVLCAIYSVELMLKIDNFGRRLKWFCALCDLGKKYSLTIYIIHICVLSVLRAFELANTYICFFVSWFLAFIWQWSLRYIQNVKKRFSNV